MTHTDLIDKTNLVLRHLKLVEMAIECIEEESYADALYEGLFAARRELNDLKQMIETLKDLPPEKVS